MYHNYLSKSAGDVEDSEQFYIMPKLQKLLMVLKEYRTANANGETKVEKVLMHESFTCWQCY